MYNKQQWCLQVHHTVKHKMQDNKTAAVYIIEVSITRVYASLPFIFPCNGEGGHSAHWIFFCLQSNPIPQLLLRGPTSSRFHIPPTPGTSRCAVNPCGRNWKTSGRNIRIYTQAPWIRIEAGSLECEAPALLTASQIRKLPIQSSYLQNPIIIYCHQWFQ